MRSTLRPMDGQLTTCSSCGAGNPASAEWCSQCFAPVTPAVSEQPSGWTCTTCQAINSTALSVCGTCGSSIYTSFEERREIVMPREAVRASFVPGRGLFRLGARVEGVLTFVLVVFAVGWGLLVVGAGNAGGWALTVVGLGLWLVAMRDAFVIASRRDDGWLDARSISVVAGVIIITAAILVLRTPLNG